MPFPSVNARPYNRPQMNRLPAHMLGVYGIWNEERWLKIGRSVDIRQTLIDLWETDAELDRLRPIGFSFELTSAAQIREALLVAEYRPLLNENARRRVAV